MKQNENNWSAPIGRPCNAPSPCIPRHKPRYRYNERTGKAEKIKKVKP